MVLKTKEILKKIYLSKWFVLFLIFAGIAVRLRQYVFCRSLWLDEAMLAVNILRHNYAELLRPLDFTQQAPPLFLLATNFLTELFGHSEYVLRFLPMLAGIASLFLFWYLAKKILNKYMVPVAVSLLAFSRYAIYYSNELKQYSIDLMATIIIIILAIYVYEKSCNLRSSLILGFSGALLTWFSHSSVFVLAGVSLSLLIALFIKEKLKNKKKYVSIFLLSLIWMASFGINFLLITKQTMHQKVFNYFSENFAPISITSISDLSWYPETVLAIIKNPLYIYFPGIALLAIFAGIIFYFKKKEKFLFFLFLLPIIFTIIASMLKIYPLHGRLLLFTVPILYLLLIKGIEEISFDISKKNIITFMLILLILIQTTYWSAKILYSPESRSETRPLIGYYIDNKAEGDKTYVYYASIPAFLYYTGDNPEEFIEGINSRTEPEKNIMELGSLDGSGRVWFIFSHVYSNEEDIFVEKLEELGKRIDYQKTEGASLYLYDI